MTIEREAIKASWLSIIVNFLMAFIKGIAGLYGNSYALIADAIESVTDIFTSVLLLAGLRIAYRPADENHPYGHGKIEAVITFIIVIILLGSAAAIAYQSIINITTPHQVPETYTIFVLGGVVIFKELFFRTMNRKAEKLNSSVLKADAWHHRSDAITSFTAMIGISIALLLGEGYESADDWAALLAAGFIVYNSYQIFRPALGEIMDEQLYGTLILQIRETARSVHGIIDTEKCRVRKSGIRFHVDLHATVNGKISVTEGHELAHLLKDAILSNHPEVADVLIHIEPQ